MTFLQWPAKDPNEVLDYTVDWSARLTTGEKIDASTFTVDADSAVTIQSQTFSHTTATVWLINGTVGKTAEVLNRVTTSAGRVMDETVLLPIQTR
jgi:hypothetical protein